MTVQLEYFTVTCHLTAVVVDYQDLGQAPDLQPISSTVDFIPRVPTGTLVWASGLTPPQGLALPRIRARTDADGILKTIQGDIGVQLVANTDILDMDQLIYDVVWSNVLYNRADQQIKPFSFIAPSAGGMTVDLSRVDKLAPAPPSWYPAN